MEANQSEHTIFFLFRRVSKRSAARKGKVSMGKGQRLRWRLERRQTTCKQALRPSNQKKQKRRNSTLRGLVFTSGPAERSTRANGSQICDMAAASFSSPQRVSDSKANGSTERRKAKAYFKWKKWAVEWTACGEASSCSGAGSR